VFGGFRSPQSAIESRVGSAELQRIRRSCWSLPTEAPDVTRVVSPTKVRVEWPDVTRIYVSIRVLDVSRQRA
jgi:hypothetical protein